MTLTLDDFDALDVYRNVFFPLNDDGTFDLTGVEDICDTGGIQDLFEGIEFSHPISWEPSFGNPRQIPVVSQGQTQDTFMLPSTDPKTGVIRTAYRKLSVDAKLAGLDVEDMGLGKLLPIDSDRVGQERLVVLFLQQLQAHKGDGSNASYCEVYHRTRIKANTPGFSDAPNIQEFNVAVSRSMKRAWGQAYSLAVHKCTEAAGDSWLTESKQNMGVWIGDNSLTTFNLPAGRLAKTSASAFVWDFTAGTEEAGAWDDTVNAAVFTPTSTPPDGHVMVCMYEYA